MVTLSEPAIILSGWLQKKGGLFKSTFQKRYFVLRRNCLERYAGSQEASAGPAKAKAVIQIDEIVDARVSNDPRAPDYAFDIYFLRGESLTLAASSVSDRERWLQALSNFVFAQQKLNAKCILEGLLQHSKDYGKSWTDHFVVVFPDRILAYEGTSTNTATEVSVLVFTPEFYVSDAPGSQWGFQVSDFETSYYFGAQDEQTRFFWMHALARIIRKLRAEMDLLESSLVAASPNNDLTGNLKNVGSAVMHESNVSFVKPGTALLLYDFEAESEGELSVPADAFVILVEKFNADFWLVNYDGKTGYVQTDYMQILKPLPPRCELEKQVKQGVTAVSTKPGSIASPGASPSLSIIASHAAAKTSPKLTKMGCCTNRNGQGGPGSPTEKKKEKVSLDPRDIPSKPEQQNLSAKVCTSKTKGTFTKNINQSLDEAPELVAKPPFKDEVAVVKNLEHCISKKVQINHTKEEKTTDPTQTILTQKVTGSEQETLSSCAVQPKQTNISDVKEKDMLPYTKMRTQVAKNNPEARKNLTRERVMRRRSVVALEKKKSFKQDSPSIGGGNLKKRLALWNSRINDYEQKQKGNVFSGKYEREGVSEKIKIEKNKDYGKPKEGTLTAKRAEKAKEWVQVEIAKLLMVIVDIGGKTDDGLPCICFGPLFIAYQDISDTLVGILMRAKKYKYLEYQGDMLFQGCHDKVQITLTPKGMDKLSSSKT